MISRRGGAIFLLTVGIVFGMVAPGSAVALQENGDSAPSAIPDSQVLEVSNGGQIHAWERAAYTLRTDDTAAATQIPQAATVQGERLGGGEFGNENDGVDSKSLVREFGDERNPMGVHDSGESVTISFDANLATSGTYDQLNGQDNVEVVAARLTPIDGRGVPSSTEETFDLLSDIDSANGNASFEILNNSAELDATGRLEESASFSSGRYVILAVVHESGRNGMETRATGADVDAGNVSVDGDVTVIGMEQLTVQQGQSDVTPPSGPSPGDDLTFDVDATSAFDASEDGSVTHAVAVYNRSTFEDARFDLVVNESALGNDFSLADNSQLEHSIAETNGVASVEPGTTINGNDLSDGEVTRPVGAASVLDFLAEEAGTNDPSTHPITVGGASNTETETIDASVTAVNGEDRSASVSVDTFGNFSEGTYRYVVVSALDDNESQVSTATGTLTLGAEESDGGGGGGGPDTSPPPSDDDDTDDGPIVQTPVVRANGTTSVNVSAVSEGETIAIAIEDNETEDNGTDGDGGPSLEQLNITSTGDSENVSVTITESQQPSEGTPANDQDVATLGYVNVSLGNVDNPDGTPGRFTFTLSSERLANLGATPSEVQMYRYNGSWAPIETTYFGGNRFQAQTPGFSSFAIGATAQTLSVTDASLNATAVQPGDAVAVTATVENSAGTDGNVTLDLTVDGDAVENRTVAVGANNSTVETFVFTPSASGSYDIGVGRTSAGTVTVAQPTATSTPPTEAETGTATPGPPTETEAGTATAAPPTETPTPGTTFLGGGVQVFIVTIIVLAIVALLAVLRFEFER